MRHWTIVSIATVLSLAISSCVAAPDSEEENIGMDVAALCTSTTGSADGCGCPHEPPPPVPAPCPDGDSDGDGICNYDDACDGTVIPEDVPTHGLAVNHFALVDHDGIFDTIPPRGGPERIFTIADTAGCSCEQILYALGGRFGQYRNGCSYGTMLNWVRNVNGGHGHPHP